MNHFNMFRWISCLALIILVPVVGNLAVPASQVPTPQPTPTATPAPATPTPPPDAPFIANFMQSQPNPSWKNYTRQDNQGDFVYDMLIDEVGRVWLGGYNSLNIFDGRTWQLYTSANGLVRDAMIQDAVTALARDPAGYTWIGYDGGGLSRVALSGDAGVDRQTWQHYTLALDMVGNSVHNLAVDPAGRLWFSAGYSLGMFDGQSWTLYRANPALIGLSSPPLEPPADAPLIEPHIIEIGPDHPAYSGLSDLTIDAAGRVWLATPHGLGMFDGRQWRSYPLDSKYLNGARIVVDSTTNEVWVASSGGGVSRLTLPDLSEAAAGPDQTPTELTWTHYNQFNGLPRDDVQAIGIDATGRKWFGTNAGVTVFDGQSWQTYTQADGLPSGAIRAIAADPAGHLWLAASGSELSEFIPPAAPAPLPTPIGEVVPRLLDFTLTPTTALTVGDVISVTWQAVGEQAELCLLSGRPVYCQPAPVSGSQVITVDDALLTEAISGVWLNVTAAGQSTGIFGELQFQCRYAWFFDDAAGSCPEAPPIYSHGAAQYFERGLMIWTEQPDQFYVFFDENHQFAQFAQFDAEWVKDSSFLAPPEPLPAPTGVAPASASTPRPTAVQPPPGAFEPVSGFGRVWQHYWRYENNLPVTVRQDIGWATGPEFEFETTHQCALGTAAYHTWNCYLGSPSGTVLSFAPVSTVRDRWFWEDVSGR